MRLLPREPFARLAYVWLVYFAFLYPRSHNPWLSAVTIGAVVLFLPLYFWSYWLEGVQALIPIVGITAIGMMVFPINRGASIFFVYTGTFAGRVGGVRVAAPVLAGVVASLLADAWWFSIPSNAWVVLAGITVLIGGVVTYSTDAGRKLRKAQEHARQMAVIAERERIGRDLHDLLGHTLTVIALKAELASKLAEPDPQRSLVEIREVERISREALAEVRHAVQGSRTVILVEELRAARHALDAASITLICDTPPIAIDPGSEQTLALALREAITNVIRHSKAHVCEVRIWTADGAARLEVTDDGIGGDVAEGSGLSGMRARVSRLGGRLERAVDRGTRLTITVPLVATQAETTG